MVSFTEKLKESQSDLVYLVTGEHEGRPLWHYVQVEKIKKPFFLKAVESPFIELSEFGEVLYSGWGKEPPQSIKDDIKERFGG